MNDNDENIREIDKCFDGSAFVKLFDYHKDDLITTLSENFHIYRYTMCVFGNVKCKHNISIYIWKFSNSVM